MQKRNKKGFTLAELLIVVAIIAVLVAIAVPLFVGALNDAEQRTFEANQHAVKSAAVAYILENKTDLTDVEKGTKYIKAVGTFTAQGDFTGVTVTLDTSEVTDTTLDEWKENEKTSLTVGVDFTNIKAS